MATISAAALRRAKQKIVCRYCRRKIPRVAMGRHQKAKHPDKWRPSEHTLLRKAAEGMPRDSTGRPLPLRCVYCDRPIDPQGWAAHWRAVHKKDGKRYVPITPKLRAERIVKGAAAARGRPRGRGLMVGADGSGIRSLMLLARQFPTAIEKALSDFNALRDDNRALQQREDRARRFFMAGRERSR